ncbi:MAG: hypothetical protein HEP80_04375 [Dolichospermum sp. UKL201]|nr:MAG: hypothetical protein HEP80_04375 [Dolichospermum sp. UKL201]
MTLPITNYPLPITYCPKQINAQFCYKSASLELGNAVNKDWGSDQPIS